MTATFVDGACALSARCSVGCVAEERSAGRNAAVTPQATEWAQEWGGKKTKACAKTPSPH